MTVALEWAFGVVVENYHQRPTLQVATVPEDEIHQPGALALVLADRFPPSEKRVDRSQPEIVGAGVGHKLLSLGNWLDHNLTAIEGESAA